MSGYRDELESALQQVALLREETARLRSELDATRAANTSSLGTALVAWTHASPRARAAILVAPLAIFLAGLAINEGTKRAFASYRPPPPLGVAEPLIPNAPPVTICPEPRPCVERHPTEAAPSPPREGIIRDGEWQGYREVYPSLGEPDPTLREGIITVRTDGPRGCTIDGVAFRAPTTLSRRGGVHTVVCELPFRHTARWRAWVTPGMVTRLVPIAPYWGPR